MNTTKIRKVMEILIRVLGFNMLFRIVFGGIDPLKKEFKILLGFIAQYSIILLFPTLGFVSFELIASSMDNVLREASLLVNIAIIPLFTVLLVSFLLGGYVIAYYYNKWITKRLQIDIEM